MQWIVPTESDLDALIARIAGKQANEQLEEPADPDAPLDPTRPSRKSRLLKMAIDEWRGTAARAGVHAISATPNSVPPEAVPHVLARAAYMLVASTPSLTRYLLLGEQGQASPLAHMFDMASKHYEDIGNGGDFSPPDDPLGRDYKTPVSASNPMPRAISWGDYLGVDDEYAQGVSGTGRLLSRWYNDMSL
jgi:hypothetical protein